MTDRPDLLQELFVRNCDFPILVTALLLVRNLIFDLKCTGASFDHLLGEQIGRFCITESSVNISDDRNDMRLVLVNLMQKAMRCYCVTRFFCRVKIAEHST